MSGNANRILTTHVGSLVRPPKLIAFWRAIEDGKPYDEAAFETSADFTLEDYRDFTVRRQIIGNPNRLPMRKSLPKKSSSSVPLGRMTLRLAIIGAILCLIHSVNRFSA